MPHARPYYRSAKRKRGLNHIYGAGVIPGTILPWIPL